jgi:hypothetical protein
MQSPILSRCALLVGILALAVAAPAVWAGQSHFESQRIGGRLQLDYGWVDRTGDHSLTVQFDPAAVESARKGFRPYRRADLQATANAELKRRLTRAAAELELNYPGLKVSVGRDLKLRPRFAAGVDDQAAITREIADRQSEIEDDMQAFELDYLGKRLYQLDDTGGILPNYGLIARRALPGLAPLAQALGDQVRGLPTRAALTRVLAFVQTIPFDPLKDRHKDPGLLPPLVMLAENRGDCDTKSLAFAALAHLLFPEVPSALILVPDHAVLALGLPTEPGDRVVNFQDRDWVLSEPVGPATPPVGEIGPDSPAAQDRTADIVPLFP